MNFLQQLGHKAKPILGGLALTALLGASLPATAHEFILKPDTATPAAGHKTRVQAQASPLGGARLRLCLPLADGEEGSQRRSV